MVSKIATFRLPEHLIQEIRDRAETTGRDRTAVVIEALKQVFGLSTSEVHPSTVGELQTQLEELEKKFTTPNEAKIVTLRLPENLIQEIRYRAEMTGRDRTAVFVEALKQAFGLPTNEVNPSTVGELQTHLEELEKKFTTPNAVKIATFRLPENLIQEIRYRAEMTDRDRTAVFVEALKQAFGLPTSEVHPSTVGELQTQLEELEKKFTTPNAAKIVTLRLPENLIQEIRYRAEMTGRDRSAVCIEALKQAFGLPTNEVNPSTVGELQAQLDGLENNFRTLFGELQKLQEKCNNSTDKFATLQSFLSTIGELQRQFASLANNLTLESALLDAKTQESYSPTDDLLLFLKITRFKVTANHYLSIHHPEKAKFYYHQIIACLDRLQEERDIITRRSLMNSYLEIYKLIVAVSIYANDFKSAFLYAEISRNRYLVERLAKQDASLPDTVSLKLSKQVEEAKLIEKRSLQLYSYGLSHNLDKQLIAELNEQWSESKRELKKLYVQISEIEPEFIAKTKVYPISFPEVQSLLPPDTAILEFFFTGKVLLTMLIVPGEEQPVIPEDLCLELRDNSFEGIAREWISDLTAKNSLKKDGGIDETIQRLPNWIDQISDSLNFRNLLNSIPLEIQHLIVVPNNYLHLFPIHALWVNAYQRLVDRFAISYFPSLQVWKICQNRQRSRSSLIGIENPTQDKDLIFAKAEVASISQRIQFIQSQVLTGQEASKSDILRSATHHHCFHFSGHAEYNFENPLDSYLMLSENSDENLSLNTIFADMHMPQADLVTLSACCTGVVDAFQPTEEHLGLATGFLLAGAKAVIGSQWKVNSISTAFLLDEFYRQLDETDNKAVALQNAQNWLRSCTADQLRERASTWDLSKLEPKEQFRLERALKRLKGIPFQNPYYWAAFILTGC